MSNIEINKPTFRYLLDRLEEITTQSDLENLREEFQGYLPLDQYEDGYDVHSAINEVKRDYIGRAIAKSKNLQQASNLLGLKSYQVLISWMTKLDIKR